MKKLLAAAGIAAAVTLLLSGCDLAAKAIEPFRDAPRSGVVNQQPADIITMPDGFSNIATKCDHGNRIYVAYHGDSPYASIEVVADSRCPVQ